MLESGFWYINDDDEKGWMDDGWYDSVIERGDKRMEIYIMLTILYSSAYLFICLFIYSLPYFTLLYFILPHELPDLYIYTLSICIIRLQSINAQYFPIIISLK